MRRLLIFPILALLPGCDLAPLGRVDGEVVLAPAQLELGEVWVGYPVRANATLSNSSKATQVAALSADAPLALEASELKVPGGSDLGLTLTFAPTLAGPFSGSLRVVIDGKEQLLAFSGTAREPPPCPPADGCHVAGFDPASGACSSAKKPDGAGCSAGTCLENGQCSNGACVGSAKSCDDGNACTVDACDSNGACVHVSNGGNCAQPDPATCTVGYCDPDDGCTTGPAVDGTVCGSVDCVTAHLCFSGKCMAASVPDGTACGPTSPCQQAGACHDGVCKQGAKTEIAARWRYTSAKYLVSQVVMDGADQLYFMECWLDCDLVSLTRDGYERYRVAVGQVGNYQFLLSNGRLLFRTPDGIQIRDSGTGALLQSIPLLALVQSELLHPPTAGTVPSIWHLASAADGNGRVLLSFAVIEASGKENLGGFLVALDLSTGGLLWRQRTWERFVLDETGAVFTLAFAPSKPLDLISLSSGGVERWRVPIQGYATAAHAGHLLAWDESGRFSRFDSSTGARSTLMASTGFPLVLRGDSLWTSSGDPLNPAISYVVRKLDLRTGLTIWETPATDPQPVIGPGLLLLSEKNELLFVVRSPTGATLHGYSDTGVLSLSCDLSDPGYVSGLQLGKGRLFIRGLLNGQDALTAYDVPGYSLASSGWVTEGGNPEWMNRPR